MVAVLDVIVTGLKAMWRRSSPEPPSPPSVRVRIAWGLMEGMRRVMPPVLRRSPAARECLTLWMLASLLRLVPQDLPCRILPFQLRRHAAKEPQEGIID
jgi:hypothetical protein